MAKDAQNKNRKGGRPKVRDEVVDPVASMLWYQVVHLETASKPYGLNLFFGSKRTERIYRRKRTPKGERITSTSNNSRQFDRYKTGEHTPGIKIRKRVDNALKKRVSAWLELPLFELLRDRGMTYKKMHTIFQTEPRLNKMFFNDKAFATPFSIIQRLPSERQILLSKLNEEGDIVALTACAVLIRQAIENGDEGGYMDIQEMAFLILLRVALLKPWSQFVNEFCGCVYERLLATQLVKFDPDPIQSQDGNSTQVALSTWLAGFCPDLKEFKEQLKIRFLLIQQMSNLGLLDSTPTAHRACVHAAETLGLPAIMAILGRFSVDGNRYSAALDPRLLELQAAIRQSNAVVEDLPGIEISVNPDRDLVDALIAKVDPIQP